MQNVTSSEIRMMGFHCPSVWGDRDDGLGSQKQTIANIDVSALAELPNTSSWLPPSSGVCPHRAAEDVILASSQLGLPSWGGADNTSKQKWWSVIPREREREQICEPTRNTLNRAFLSNRASRKVRSMRLGNALSIRARFE